MTKSRTQRTKERNDKIRRDFKKWTSQKVDGVQKFSTEYILSELSKTWFLSPTTIEKILTK